MSSIQDIFIVKSLVGASQVSRRKDSEEVIQFVSNSDLM